MIKPPNFIRFLQTRESSYKDQKDTVAQKRLAKVHTVCIKPRHFTILMDNRFIFPAPAIELQAANHIWICDTVTSRPTYDFSSMEGFTVSVRKCM
jgi:hypothetical protein